MQTVLGELIREKLREQRLKDIFDHFPKETVCRFWDEVGDNSFYVGPEGEFDCADIYLYLCLNGYGHRCIV